jgi:hypothetical protein
MRNGGYRRRPGAVAGLLGSSVAATFAVIALVGVLVLMFGQRGERMDRVVAQNTSTTASPRPAAQAPIPVAPAPGGVSAAQPAPSASAVAVAPVAPAAPPAVTPGRRAPVVIFDQSRRHSLVLQFRAALQAAGWRVDGTGPWVGKIPETTVYYPAGMEAAAKALMTEFPAITRSLPAFAGVPADALTVIICSDFRLS